MCPSSSFCYCTRGIDMSNFLSTILKNVLVSWTSHLNVQSVLGLFHSLVMQITALNKEITAQEKNTSQYNSVIIPATSRHLGSVSKCSTTVTSQYAGGSKLIATILPQMRKKLIFFHTLRFFDGPHMLPALHQRFVNACIIPYLFLHTVENWAATKTK